MQRPRTTGAVLNSPARVAEQSPVSLAGAAGGPRFCPRCGNVTPHDAFDRCKPCRNELARLYRQRPEVRARLRVSRRKYYADHRKDVLRKRREYVARKREVIRAYDRALYARNRDRICEKKRIARKPVASFLRDWK